MAYLIAHDIGTSSVRSLLTTDQGVPLHSAVKPLTVQRPRPSWAEQRPADWIEAIAANTHELLRLSSVPKGQVAALSFAAQMQGTIPVDVEGEPLTNALIWLDMRAEPESKRAVSGFPSAQGYGLFRAWRWLRVSCGVPGLSGRDPVAKMLWFQAHAPDIWQRTACFLDVKDFVLGFCTGRFVTSRDCANTTWLMDTRPKKMEWSAELISRLKLDRKKLPEILKSTDQAGTLTKRAAERLGLEEGTRVFVGAGDLAAMAIGTGATAQRAITIAVGTSAWVTAHDSVRQADVANYTATICSAMGDQHLLAAHQENGGGCMQWLRDTVAPHLDIEALLQLGEQSPPGSRGLVFLPWMSGEYAPIDDPFVRGGFLNLSFDHSLADMVRAVVEGIVYNVAWALSVVERMLGGQSDDLRLGGGAVQSALWCQTIADVLQRPVHRGPSPEFAVAQGAAILGAVGLGTRPNLLPASKGEVFTPNSSTAAVHRAGKKRLQDMYRNNRKMMQRMNRPVSTAT